MIRKFIKKLFLKVFKGRIFPVFNNQLKGLHLKIDPVLPPLHFFREIEKENHHAYDTFIKPGNVIFDIGANIGLHSYYFAKKFKNVSVYSFEPLPANANYIKEIISLNKLTNIRVIEKAAGAETGAIFFDTFKNNHQGSITKAPTDLSVEIITLDDFIKEQNIKPDFIKIDVEGVESEVLWGFKHLISSINPVIIIELHTSQQSKLVADFFRPLAYTILRVTFIENWDKRKRFIPIKNISKNEQVPDDFWGTIIAVPDIKIQSFNYLTD